MMDRQTIHKRLVIKEKEIQHLEDRLREARGYVKALRELLGLDPNLDRSMVDQARDIISRLGHPVHITELLAAMGKDITRENRVSLTSALSAYVRRRDVFVKVGPNKFGLIEFNRSKVARVKRDSPPDDFGKIADNECPPDKNSA